jgi:pyruvate kinase
MRKAKIICTIGPGSSTEEIMKKMVLAGMDVARLNFSHGTHRSHTQLHAQLRKVAKSCNRPLAILQDVQGPRIRLGQFQGGMANLHNGDSFVLTTAKITGNDVRASVQYASLPKDVKKGDRVLIADGTIQLRVNDVEKNEVITKVIVGGTVRDHNGINLPGVSLSGASVTEKDKKDIRLGLKLGMDMLAVSFVRNPEDVLTVRRMIRKAKKNSLVLAKIEHPDAVKHLNEILDVCDGIMVARGDLGVELPLEKVPAIQKSAISHANARGKIVVVATQMLESMVSSPRPTRAEASDVANAVFDGADALMLSGETASGAYPVESLQMMVRIVTQAERSPAFQAAARPRLIKDHALFPNAIGKATVEAAGDTGARLIVAFTESGNTARLISDYRPDARIIAMTPHQDTYNRLAVYWGVEPIRVPAVRSTDAMLRQANHILVERGFVRPGEVVVITSGVPIGVVGSTNMLKLHRIQ